MNHLCLQDTRISTPEKRFIKKKPMMRDFREETTSIRGEAKRLNPQMEELIKAYEMKDLSTVKEVLSSGLSINYREPAKSNRTPLVLAAKYNFVEAVNELLEKGADPRVSDDAGMTPLHAAACNGSIEPLKRLLEEKEVDPNAKDVHGKTPLHFATQALGEDEEDHALNIIQALLDAGAKVSIKDEDDRTPVHAAAWAGNAEVLSLLLSGQGAFLVSAKDKYGRTPLHQAALGARSLLAVKILLHYKAPIDGIDKQGRTVLHYIAERPINYIDKDFDEECLELLLSCGAKVHIKDNDGLNALSLALQRTMWWSKSPKDAVLHCVQFLVAKGSSIIDGFDMWRIVETFPSLVMVALNQSITSNTSAKDSPHLRLTFDFRPLTVTTRLLNERPKRAITPITLADELPIPPPLLCDTEISMLHYIFWAGQKNILRHPLCSALLHLKWLKVRKFFIMHGILYLLFVTAFTAFIISCGTGNMNMNNSTYFYNNSTDFKNNEKHYNLHDSLKKLVIIFAVTLAIKEVIQIGHSPFIYFRHFENYMDIYILISVVLLMPGEFCEMKWERQISILAVIISWARLMLFLGQFPSCGVYIVMFSTVCKTVLRFLSLYLPLLIAFSLGFLILFREMDSQASIVSSIASSFVSTLIMMTGEINEEEIQQDKNIFFSSLILVMFLLLMYIILSNLLVALAVNDLNAIQQRSELLRLSSQVELMVTVERFLNSPCIPKGLTKILRNMLSVTDDDSQTITVFPNKKPGFTEKLFLKILFVFRCRKVLTKIFEYFVNFIPPEVEPSLPKTLVREAKQIALTEREIEKRDRLLYSKSNQIGSVRQRALRRNESQSNPSGQQNYSLPRRDSLEEKVRVFRVPTEDFDFDPLITTSRQQIGMMKPTPSLKAALWRAKVRQETCRLNVANSEKQILTSEIEALRKQVVLLKNCIDNLIVKLPSKKCEYELKRSSFPFHKPRQGMSPLARSFPISERSSHVSTSEGESNELSTIPTTEILSKIPHVISSDDENSTYI